MELNRGIQDQQRLEDELWVAINGPEVVHYESIVRDSVTERQWPRMGATSFVEVKISKAGSMAPSLLHLLFQKLPKFLSWCRKVEIQWSVICEQHKLQIKIIWVSNVFIHLEECNLLLGLVKALQGCLWFSRIILQITQNLQRNSKQDKFSHSCFLFPA